MLTIRSPIWVLSALAFTASALDWNGPVSTAVDQGSSTGYSPKPTPPPMPYVGGQSTESLFGVPDLKRAEREDLCGWISTDGNPCMIPLNLLDFRIFMTNIWKKQHMLFLAEETTHVQPKVETISLDAVDKASVNRAHLVSECGTTH
jgi:hypothetical protein